MKLLSRVVWSEGMHLAPHHFQTQSRYFEDAIHFAVSSLWFAPYGLAACEMDHEALKNATVAVLQARGLFPDGLPFYIPGSDPPPEPRSIGAAWRFPAAVRRASNSRTPPTITSIRGLSQRHALSPMRLMAEMKGRSGWAAKTFVSCWT